MASKALYSSITVHAAYADVTISGQSKSNGIGADTQGSESFAVVITPTSGINPVVGPAIIGFEDNDVSTSVFEPTWETVPSDSIIGIPSDEALTTEIQAKKLGYIGKKRYVRATITGTAPGVDMIVNGTYIMSVPHNAPTSS